LNKTIKNHEMIKCFSALDKKIAGLLSRQDIYEYEIDYVHILKLAIIVIPLYFNNAQVTLYYVFKNFSILFSPSVIFFIDVA